MDQDEKPFMREQARMDEDDHPWPPMYLPEPGECQECGSMNTFKTYDKKLVCRNCWHVAD